MYSNVSSLMTSMIGHTTAVLKDTKKYSVRLKAEINYIVNAALLKIKNNTQEKRCVFNFIVVFTLYERAYKL